MTFGTGATAGVIWTLVKVELNFGQLLKGKARVEGLELEEANVALPVDPERPELTVIELKNFNARVFFREQRLQVVHAIGEVAGVGTDVTVDLQLAPVPASEEDKKAAKVAAARRLELMRDYRAQVQLGLDWLQAIPIWRTAAAQCGCAGIHPEAGGLGGEGDAGGA
jgi:hypothetical protein